MASPHVLDAILCLIACADFAAGEARSPSLEQQLLARREGWIWVRDPRP